ncbi:conserved Plasmodium membrane protein, unknown function [Plasmodium gallinaceum]|uniref:Uncharacterized protein n=1 Tax=Plasmodium gallinaceum TaxID=5849 RepID=A0A1J1GRC5_PLAGA|nr:conserved Plasmodium membrane protein, unknown function [Plasmodium gallinaceum]CRG93594.1 conserved Plasmodium membrane protein, unknown function [Plasmodium gallinaceum]
MDIIELIENRKFEIIYKNVKLKKLEKFFFCFQRYNNLYKGKNKYITNIWKSIINEKEYFNKFNDFTFVNFKYICNFFINIPQKLNDDEYEELICKKGVENNPSNTTIVEVFLIQLFYVIKQNSNILKKINVEENEQNNDTKQNKDSENRNFICNKFLNKDFVNFSKFIYINENNEFEILFNIIHPLIYNTYVTNLIKDKIESSIININECFLKYMVNILYVTYMKNRDILFFYYMIYKNLKKIKKNIINNKQIIIEQKIAKFIKRKFKKVINNFKCLRTFLINIGDSNIIHNFVNFIFTFLYNELINISSNKWENNYISYKEENNLFEFSFFIYLSIQDLCVNSSSVFNYNIQKIKNILKNEQNILFDIYMFLYFINNSDCDNCVKLKLILLCLIKWNILSDLPKQNDESFLCKIEDTIYNDLIEKKSSELNYNENENDDDNNNNNNNISSSNNNNNNNISSSNNNNNISSNNNNNNNNNNISSSSSNNIYKYISNYLKNNDELINYYLKKKNYYNFNYLLKYIYICCYNNINNKKEYYIKYDSFEKIENTYMYNYCGYSDVIYSSNYLSTNVNDDLIKSNYINIISILLHMSIININDIWSCYLLNLIENNYFFQILNFLKYKKKNVLFYLTISTFLKINYELIYAFMNLEELKDVKRNYVEINFYVEFYKNKMKEEYFLKINSLRKEIVDYASNENRILDILCFLSMNITKEIIKLPLNILKSVFKEIFKYLSKPIHDIKKSISNYFSNMCLRIVFYIFELIFIISSYIYYSNEVENIKDYNKKFYIFSFYFNLIDVYVNFVEKYNKKNNAYILSFLNYQFIQAFLLLFNYSLYTKKIINDSLGIDKKKHEKGITNKEKRTNFSDNLNKHIIFNYNKNKKNKTFFENCSSNYLISNGQKRTMSPNRLNIMENYNYHNQNSKQLEENFLNVKQKENMDVMIIKQKTLNQSNYNYITSIILKFIENNNEYINCYFYTLLMYAIAKLHLSHNYRFREINYLIFLHILPWGSCLDFSIRNSQLSCFFFQKFYECVQNLLPEIVVEHFQDDLNFNTTINKTNILINCFDKEKQKKENFEREFFNSEIHNENCDELHKMKNMISKNKEKNFDELNKYNLEILNLYEQIISGRNVIKALFFSENYKKVDVYYLNKILKSSVLKNCLLITTFINIYFLKKKEPFLENNFIDVIQSLFDEKVSSYYISIFQNPLNFFLNCPNAICELLVQYDCLDNLLSFIFTKLYYYLSLIPPKLSPEDFLPINVEDITSLQETAVAQFILNLKKENLKENDKQKEKYKIKSYKYNNLIFQDLNFFLKKMDVLVKTFNLNCLNSICESGFNAKSAFYLSFYITPAIFTNIFYYLNNNIMAIVNENFNLEDNLKYYEHIHIKKKEHTLEPYNIIDKTIFYLQMVVFYLIINANNKLMNISNYIENVCIYFTKCLQTYSKAYVGKLIILMIPIMLQYFYFFPSFIPSVIMILPQISSCDKEFTKEILKFENKIRKILEISYKFGSEQKI